MAKIAFAERPASAVPVLGSWDAVIVGGGIAGISAALAAKRCGAERVLLIEKLFQLGGLATSGLITIYLPLCDGCGRQVTFGQAEELLRLSVSRGAEAEYPEEWFDSGSVEARTAHRYRCRFNAALFAALAEKELADCGVEILYGTTVSDVIKDTDGNIASLILPTKRGEAAVSGSVFIDATGDADIAEFAGESTVEFTQGNILASWYYSHEGSEYRLNKLGFSDIPDKYKQAGSGLAPRGEIEEGQRYAGLDPFDLSDMSRAAHQSIINHFAKGGNVTPDHAIASIATTPQIRMTRRLAGLYTMDDCEMHKEFEDSTGLYSDWRRPGPVYELPYSCLIGSRVPNLACAGRCISVTENLWDVSRSIPVCALSGQAAGTAAALVLGNRTRSFADLDTRILAQVLEASGVVLHERDL